MNKKEAIIQDTINICINDEFYLRYIVEEYINNLSMDKINLLYEELETSKTMNIPFE